MKKHVLALVGILFILIGTVCGTGDTITDNPRNHVYGPNEVINIYDNVDNGDLIGTLRIASVNVLSEGPNYITQMVSVDEEGNSVYEEVEYAQLIQINYVYEAVKGSSQSIDSYNFEVEDGNGRRAGHNPETAYTMIPIENVESFVILTKNNTTVLNIDFNYKPFQFEHTAKILMSITDDEVGEPIVTAPQATASNSVGEPVEEVPATVNWLQRSDNTEDLESRITVLKNILVERDRTIESLEKTIDDLNNENGMNQRKGREDVMVFLVAGLGIMVFVLSMTIYGKNKDINELQAQLKKKSEK